MIRLVDTGGAREFEVTSESPLIYLDHWALRLFSSHATLRRKFFEVFTHRGTLLFSLVNVTELAANSGTSAKHIRSFLEEIGPHWAPITMDPSKVVEAESRLNPEVGDRSVCFGSAMLEDQHFMSKLSTGDLTLAHVVDLTRGDDGNNLRAAMSESVQEMLALILTLRTRYNADPSGLDLSYPLQVWNPRQPMKFVYYGLMRLIVRESFKLDENHVRDFLHAAVAATVAQMLLLDPHWAVLVRKLKLPPDYVQVYSKAGVGLFLSRAASLPTTR